MKITKENRLQWHPACFAALNLEFLENKEELEFFQEHSVSELPLRIDTLIIKKTRTHKLRNEIGDIFRCYNLVEYKSPRDEMTFNTFLKGIAEVYLYKIKQEKTRIESYSLTFIRDRKPVALFQMLNSLTKKLSVEQVKELIEKLMEENVMCQALMEIMKPKFDAAVAEAVNAAVAEAKESAFNDGFNGGIDDKGMKVFINMIKRGFSKEDAQAVAEISDELVEKALTMC